ncbi:unnamed protein product, partial [Ilex paraguariensis]
MARARERHSGPRLNTRFMASRLQKLQACSMRRKLRELSEIAEQAKRRAEVARYIHDQT